MSDKPSCSQTESQSKYTGPCLTETTETSKYKWFRNQQRDSYSSFLGHSDMVTYFAISENEAIARIKFNLMEKMLQPSGTFPEKQED